MEPDAQSDYGSTWYSRTRPLPAPRPALSYDLDVDVCVIGGGVAGLTVAREVTRRGWSVAILEARRIAWNASSRNGGAVAPGFPVPVETVIERVGLPAAKGLWELSKSGAAYIHDVIAHSGEEGLLAAGGELDVARWPDDERIARRVALMAQMGVEAAAWPADRVRDVLRTSHYFGAVHFPGAFQIDPLGYALCLARAALKAGARIFENTRVTAVDLAGVRKRIETPRGRVRSAHVVLAGNVHLGAMASPISETIIPVTAFTGLTRPLGKRLALAVTFEGAVTHGRRAPHHYRIVGHDRLMWTAPTWGGAGFAARTLKQAIWRTYPQLGQVAFEQCWPADMGFAVHGMPQIGEFRRGVWLASAFGAKGLNTAAMAGALIAAAITERDDQWRRFVPFELVWAGGRTGRSLTFAAASFGRLSDDARALLARRHEAFERKRLEKKGAAAAGGSSPGESSGGQPGGSGEAAAGPPERAKECVEP